MIFREALPQEINFIFSEGYKEWSKNRKFEQYCTDNAKEDVYGTRYVLDVNNEIVSSLIILKLKDIVGKKAYGIGSVLTPKIHAGKGYAVQVREDMFHLGRFKRLKVATIYGKFPFHVQEKELKQKTHVVVGTPGRLIDHIERGTLDTSEIQY
ncbi:MAG: DEAD/DEAH box helicase, partial [Desulfosporosinus sp.]|nr:DEAD/DEAH box helicase [Desulfosporosinus sp.]